MGEARLIEDWKELEPGMYVRLECGCEGFVEWVQREGKTRGFHMLYTSTACEKRRSCEQAYRDRYGPYRNYFSTEDLCSQAMPALEVPIPEWVEELGLRHKLNLGEEL